MPSATLRTRGFTLIELMVTVGVIVILGLMAMPSFIALRERWALRSGTEQVVSFWNQARFEAAKRNGLVKVGVSTSGTAFCLGAATTSDPADNTPCDCFTANACDVAAFPAPAAANVTQNEWNGMTFVVDSGVTPTLGGANNMVAVIEPKRGGLTEAADAGALTFGDPAGGRDYKLNMLVDQFGRAVLCESNQAVDHMSGYMDRPCAP
jgi:prepilin-type N-terminal cleavage/methylation domain-containing protein